MYSSTERSASEAPERLTWRETGSPSRSRLPSTSSAWATTQRSSSWIIPERSAASMKAEAGSSSPSSPVIRSSSS